MMASWQCLIPFWSLKLEQKTQLAVRTPASERMDAIESENAKLKKENEELKKRLDRIEKAIAKPK